MLLRTWADERALLLLFVAVDGSFAVTIRGFIELLTDIECRIESDTGHSRFFVDDATFEYVDPAELPGLEHRHGTLRTKSVLTIVRHPAVRCAIIEAPPSAQSS